MANIHEIEQKIGSYLVRNTDAIALFVGASVLGISVVDNMKNDVLNYEVAQRRQTVLELQKNYGIREECASYPPTFGDPVIICQEVVEGAYTKEEKKKIMVDYTKALLNRKKEILVDEQSLNRGLRDALGSVFGLMVSSAALSSLLGGKEKRYGR